MKKSAIPESFSRSDALELAKLRIKEDGITWKQACAEYRSLTGLGFSASTNVGCRLRDYAACIEAAKRTRNEQLKR